MVHLEYLLNGKRSKLTEMMPFKTFRGRDADEELTGMYLMRVLKGIFQSIWRHFSLNAPRVISNNPEFKKRKTEKIIE